MGQPRQIVKLAKKAVSPVAKTLKEAVDMGSPKPTAPVTPKPAEAAPAKTMTEAATSYNATQSVTPKASVAAGESEMAATSDQTRRRRARGIATGSRGVTGSARTTRKRLLGE